MENVTDVEVLVIEPGQAHLPKSYLIVCLLNVSEAQDRAARAVMQRLRSSRYGRASADRPCNARPANSIAELLGQNAFIEAVAGIEQHQKIDFARLLHIDREHRACLDIVGNRVHGAFFRFQNVDVDLGLI